MDQTSCSFWPFPIIRGGRWAVFPAPAQTSPQPSEVHVFQQSSGKTCITILIFLYDIINVLSHWQDKIFTSESTDWRGMIPEAWYNIVRLTSIHDESHFCLTSQSPRRFEKKAESSTVGQVEINAGSTTLKPTDFHLDASPTSTWIGSQEDILPSNENCRNQVVFAASHFLST